VLNWFFAVFDGLRATPAPSPEGQSRRGVPAGVNTRTSVPTSINIDDFWGPIRTTTRTRLVLTRTVGNFPTGAFACHSTGNSEEPLN